LFTSVDPEGDTHGHLFVVSYESVLAIQLPASKRFELRFTDRGWRDLEKAKTTSQMHAANSTDWKSKCKRIFISADF